MLQSAEPVHLFCAGNMTYGVEQRVFIRFDNADVGVVQVLSNPISFHEIFRVNVRHVCFLFSNKVLVPFFGFQAGEEGEEPFSSGLTEIYIKKSSQRTE